MRAALATLVLASSAGCASGSGGGGGLGEILGSVLGGQGGQQGQGQQGQAQGTIRGVDQSRIALQLADGQQVALQYDERTTVTYQGQNYAVSNLEQGDRVTVAVQQTGNGAYYVSAVRVDQSVQEARGGAGGGSASGQAGVQQVQGVVRQIDVQNGLFSIETGNRAQYTVSLPYNVSRADNDRFRSLRAGDQVRFYGVPLNNQRIELRQFY
jgi:Cu/Ag efflux protein CusF